MVDYTFFVTTNILHRLSNVDVLKMMDFQAKTDRLKIVETYNFDGYYDDSECCYIMYDRLVDDRCVGFRIRCNSNDSHKPMTFDWLLEEMYKMVGV